MINKNKYIILLIFLIPVIHSFAKDNTIGKKTPFDFRINLGYGINSLNINSEQNIRSSQGTFVLGGLQTDYYFSKKLGIGIGVEYNASSANVILSNYKHSYAGVDSWEGDPIPRNYDFFIESNNTDIIEENRFSGLEFPFSLIYKLPISKKTNLAIRGGVKISIPPILSYKLNSSNLKTRLYFKEWDLELFEIPEQGLYDARTDWHPEGKIATNIAASFFTELGIDHPIAQRVNARLSGYFSCGLNNIIGDKHSSLIYWRNVYNSTLTLTDHASLIQIGVKLSFALLPKVEVTTPKRGQELPMM